MRPYPALLPRLWWFGLLFAAGFVLIVNLGRIDRLDAVAAQFNADAPEDAPRLVAPAIPADSAGWLLETRAAAAAGVWRLREATFDNAPFGRPTHQSAAYRGWLNLVTRLGGGDPADARDLEFAARWADPWLHLLLIVAVAVYTARTFGAWPACFAAPAVAWLYPLAGSFAPGAPHSLGLSLGLGLAATLPLLAALRSDATTAQRGFACAGLAGGAGLWVSITPMVPWLAGIALGGLLAARLTRATTGTMITPPWRIWSISGASATLVAWAFEYVPGAIEWTQLRAVHPLYAVAWLGLGELLVLAAPPSDGEPRIRRRGRTALALLALGSLPAAMLLTGSPGFLAGDGGANQLVRLPGSPTFANLSAWISRDGVSGPLLATMLPLLLLIPALHGLTRLETTPERRRLLALALGPTVVALGFAFVRLQSWAWVDAGLLLVLVACLAGDRIGATLRPGQWGWIGGTLFVLLPGVMAALATAPRTADGAPDAVEARGLVERDLARWLGRRTGPDQGVVLAPPDLTPTLAYHGGGHGLGTPYWENRDGFAAAVRLSGSHSQDEALAIVENRQLTHIVMPSWDPFLEEYARLGATDLPNSLIALLQRWLPPRWLRPVPYLPPAIPGMEEATAVVFEVVEVQDDPTALSHLAIYFVAMGDLRRAVTVADALRSAFATDVGGIVARAEVAIAVRDANRFRAALTDLNQAITDGRDRGLPWERRVALSIVLAEAGQADAATAQAQTCLRDADPDRWRRLEPGTRFRFLGLVQALGLSWDRPQDRDFARSLLSAEQREAL